MVNQYEYEVYAYHHKQNLMREAQVSCFLKRRRNLSRIENSRSIYSWLLYWLTPGDYSSRNQIRSSVDNEPNLTAEIGDRELKSRMGYLG